MKNNPFEIAWQFYLNGFRSMTLGKTLWLIILIKLFIIFFILRMFFFRPILQGSDEEKRNVVANELINRNTCLKNNN